MPGPGRRPRWSAAGQVLQDTVAPKVVAALTLAARRLEPDEAASRGRWRKVAGVSALIAAAAAIVIALRNRIAPGTTAEAAEDEPAPAEPVQAKRGRCGAQAGPHLLTLSPGRPQDHALRNAGPAVHHARSAPLVPAARRLPWRRAGPPRQQYLWAVAPTTTFLWSDGVNAYKRGPVRSRTRVPGQFTRLSHP